MSTDDACEVTGHLVDPLARNVRPATLSIVAGRIAAIRPAAVRGCRHWILPGFVDAHVHVESSLLPPAEFARLAVAHGTVATVSDPHEIANVLGVPGVEFMLDDATRSPFRFHFGAPSCVPATHFDRSGARLDADAVAGLLDRPDVGSLAEVMDYPGVVAGISTDHECVAADEALEKLALGMKILVREGSAAGNFDALAGLVDTHPDRCMFCSDDRHPDALLAGHVDALVRRARAVNAVIAAQGGLAVVDGARVDLLPLPIAGLMSDQPGGEVAAAFTALGDRARALGSTLASPFMSLSFLALLVIPALKLGPEGLFDVDRFAFTWLLAD